MYLTCYFNPRNTVYNKECIGLMRTVAGFFLKTESFKDDNLTKVNVFHPSNLEHYSEVNIGTATREYLETLGSTNDQFINKCVKFYQVCFSECMKRFTPHDKILVELEYLEPNVILGPQNSNMKPIHLCDKFYSKIKKIKVLDEFSQIPHYFSKIEKIELLKLDIVQFGKKMSKFQNFKNEFVFENVTKLAFICLCLPHANADVERTFSIVTEVKTKKINLLSVDTLSALTRVKVYMKQKKIDLL